MGPARRVSQDGHFGDLREHFLDQRQPLSDKPHREVRHACDVPTRPRETSDEPSTNGIPNRGHHDGDRAGRLFGGENHRLLCRHDDGDLEPDQFSCEIRKSIEPSSSPALLDRDIVSLDIAKFAQPFPKDLVQPFRRGRIPAVEDANPYYLCRLLRVDRERRRKNLKSQNSQKAQRLAFHGRLQGVMIGDLPSRVPDVQCKRLNVFDRRTAH